MYYFSEFDRITRFKKWLGTYPPSCNDNDDPDNDCGVSAIDPRGKTGAGAISYDLRLGQIRSVKWINSHFG